MRKKVKKILAVAVTAGLILGTSVPAFALEGDDEAGSDIRQSGENETDLGFGLFEDSDDYIQYEDGVPRDQLEKVLDSGNEAAIQKFADGTARESEGDPQEENESETQTELIESIDQLEAADPDRISQYLSDLSQFDSTTGSDGELLAADYISKVMKDLGYQVETQSFHEGFVDQTGRDEQGMNLIAEKTPNSRIKRTDDVLLLVTHYDISRDTSLTAPDAGDRTGVTVMLETARILAQEVTDTDICFLFLSGEEDGLYGSQTFIDSLNDETRSRIIGALNVEKAGYEPESFYILKTLDGEDNSASKLLRRAGLIYEAQKEKEASEAEAAEGGQGQTVPDGIGVQYDQGQTVQGSVTILGNQGQTAADGISTQDGQGQAAEDGTGVVNGEDQTEGDTEQVPAAWSCLKDQTESHATLENAGFIAATLSQYFRSDSSGQNSQEETASSAETNAPGVDLTKKEADTSADQTQLSEETESGTEQDIAGEETIAASPIIIADTANIMARAAAIVMDPNT